jgi:hypothetical protein|tara:strand:- start:1489 stop:2028 length:540 start_codon:yes stop_codon:yes gene_type:complete
MESNMICITEEQASKLEALGVTVAISYTVDAALMAALADILSINSMEEKVVRTQTRRKPKYAKRRKDNKERFTFLHASHSLDKSAEATFPLAFMVDGKAPAVCQRAQMNLFRQMRRTGLRVLSRDDCYSILKATMADVFGPAAQKRGSLSGVLFSVTKSKGFAPLWGNDGQYSTPTVNQ